MENIKVTKDNDFTLYVEAYNKEGDVEHPQDLRLVDNLVVTIPDAPIGSYTYSVDDSGRLVLDLDGPMLSVRAYGMEARGTIGGRDWCWRVKKLFEIVKYTDESNRYASMRMCMYCEIGGTTILPIKTVTMAEMGDTELLPNMLYIVVSDGDGIPPSAIPLGARAVYTIDEEET